MKRGTYVSQRPAPRRNPPMGPSLLLRRERYLKERFQTRPSVNRACRRGAAPRPAQATSLSQQPGALRGRGRFRRLTAAATPLRRGREAPGCALLRHRPGSISRWGLGRSLQPTTHLGPPRWWLVRETRGHRGLSERGFRTEGRRSTRRVPNGPIWVAMYWVVSESGQVDRRATGTSDPNSDWR